MCEPDAPREFLDNAGVDEAVFALRRDYRGLLLVAEDIAPGPTDENAEALLREAE